MLKYVTSNDGKIAEQAFKILGEPLIVNDAEWNIPALNGFPGPYVRYINEWLSPDDFIVLMSRHEDKKVFYKEVITHIDREILRRNQRRGLTYLVSNFSKKRW